MYMGKDISSLVLCHFHSINRLFLFSIQVLLQAHISGWFLLLHGFRYRDVQDLRDHVWLEPSNQWGSSRGILSLFVVKEQPVQLLACWGCSSFNQKIADALWITGDEG